MFCNRCGAKLADSAAFCNQCGSAFQKTMQTNVLPSGKQAGQSITVAGREIRHKRENKKLWILLPIMLITAVVCVMLLKKPDIRGTWTDKQGLIAFTFEEDGSLRVSGKNNILGAELFRYTDDKDGNITLQGSGYGGDKISLHMRYELSGDTLNFTVLDQSFTLYRTDEKDILMKETENAEEAQDIIENKAEDIPDTFRSASLYGSWTDISGVITFTFQDNGIIRIGGLSDMLGADLFIFTQIDNDTLRLKADSDNKLLNLISLNLKYKIVGNIMTVEIAEQTYQLIKQE